VKDVTTTENLRTHTQQRLKHAPNGTTQQTSKQANKQTNQQANKQINTQG